MLTTTTTTTTVSHSHCGQHHCCSAGTYYPSTDHINVNFVEYKLRSFSLTPHLQYKTVCCFIRYKHITEG
jgi:hypothetical protein